ncbi:MAG: hypothetical protein V7785_00695 [Bermanella sp.]
MFLVIEYPSQPKAHETFISGYHQRSLSDTAMYRLKQLMGSEFNARTFTRQAVEVFMRCKAINIMTGLGIPETYAVD